MEVLENGEADHKILARLDGENMPLREEEKSQLVEFIRTVFSHIPGKHMEIGRFLDADSALAMISSCIDTNDSVPVNAHYDSV